MSLWPSGYRSWLQIMRSLVWHHWRCSSAHGCIALYCTEPWGWSGGAKVLRILRHRGVQMILADSWVRPAILVAGKDRGGMFLFLQFLHFHFCSSFFPVPLFHLFYYSISFLPFSGRWHKMTHKGWHVVKCQHNQSVHRAFNYHHSIVSIWLKLCWKGLWRLHIPQN